MIGDAFKSFRDWAKRPFSEDQDLLHWVLFLGLVIIVSMGWRSVLKTIEG